MDYLCQVCDQEIIQNECEYKNYKATVRKKDDKSIYKKYAINNVNLDEVDKILNDYVSTHNKKFDIYFIYCEFKIQFDNNSLIDIKSEYVRNIENVKIIQCLKYSIECHKLKGYKFHNIIQMTINTVSDRCNMKYEYSIHPPMFPLETNLNIIFAKNPRLLDQNINHILL